jgi:hypothetical protein
VNPAAAELAAWCAAVLASTPDLSVPAGVFRALGLEGAIVDEAEHIFWCAYRSIPEHWAHDHVDAEIEALLRCGFDPRSAVAQKEDDDDGQPADEA